MPICCALSAGLTAFAHERKNASSRLGIILRLAPCSSGGKCWDAPGCASLVRNVIDLAGHMLCDDFFNVVLLEDQSDFCPNPVQKR